MKQLTALLQDQLKRAELFLKKERNIVAFHEAGHTVIGLILMKQKLCKK